jgi:hypothetical protein
VRTEEAAVFLYRARSVSEIAACASLRVALLSCG